MAKYVLLLNIVFMWTNNVKANVLLASAGEIFFEAYLYMIYYSNIA